MIEFEENNELWLLNFLRLKAYYTYCWPGLRPGVYDARNPGSCPGSWTKRGL